MTYEDAQAIREQCPAVQEVSVSVLKRVYDFNRPPVITARYKDKEVSGLNYSGSAVIRPVLIPGATLNTQIVFAP